MSPRTASPATPNGPDKNTASVTFSGSPELVAAFQSHARSSYGWRGVSRAGREAMEEYLAKRGVSLEDPAAVSDRKTLAKIAALRELGVSVETELDRLLDEAGGAPAPVNVVSFQSP